MKNTSAKIITITVLGTGWAFAGLGIMFLVEIMNIDMGGMDFGIRQAVAAEKLKAGMVDPKTGKKIKYYVAPMDPKYISNEPGKSPTGMDLVPVYEEEGEEKEPASTVRIDPITIQNMGVRLGRVQKKNLTKSIRAFGNITYDETRLYAVNTKFDGWIEKLHVDFVGDHVTKGQPLFDIYSPELFSAQQEYLLALQQRDTISPNASKSVRRGAERLLNASRKRLAYWDLTPDQIDKIEQTGEIRKTLTVFSPSDGVVVKKAAFKGHHVKSGVHQYEIADLSHVWVDVEVYEYEFPWIKKGMPAEMELAYIPGEKFEGHILYVYPYMDPSTRTAKLRLEFDNPEFKLKPGMYANVYLSATLQTETLVIPQEAVIDSGVRQIVFIARGKGRFQAREVTLGIEGGNYDVQVLKGLNEGEEIVVSGQFLLDSESRLQEAIQKMLEVRQSKAQLAENPGIRKTKLGESSKSIAADKLDMSGMDMDSTSPERK